MINDAGQLVLADGRKIDVNSGRVVRETTVFDLPTVSAAQSMVAATKRKMSELPSIPERMHPIAVILSYKLFGLADDEIALALNWPTDQVVRILQMKEYADMHEAVTNSIMAAETNQVRDLFTKHGRAAALKVVEHMGSDNEATSMIAAKDILDRAGHRPADVVIEQRSRMQADLVVKFVRDDRTSDMPVIDVKPIVENNNGLSSPS